MTERCDFCERKPEPDVRISDVGGYQICEDCADTNVCPCSYQSDVKHYIGAHALAA